MMLVNTSIEGNYELHESQNEFEIILNSIIILNCKICLLCRVRTLPSIFCVVTTLVNVLAVRRNLTARSLTTRRKYICGSWIAINRSILANLCLQCGQTWTLVTS